MQGKKMGPYKVTPRKLEIAAGLLQKGGYTSGKAYISVIKGRFMCKGGLSW